MICLHTLIYCVLTVLIYCVLYSMIQLFYNKILCAEYKTFLKWGKEEGGEETLVDCKNFVNGFI